VFTAKSKQDISGLFNQFLGALQSRCRAEHKQRKLQSQPVLMSIPAPIQVVINDLDSYLRKHPKPAGLIDLIDKVVYVNTLHGGKRLPKSVT
jgi:hypothetical protein